MDLIQEHSIWTVPVGPATQQATAPGEGDATWSTASDQIQVQVAHAVHKVGHGSQFCRVLSKRFPSKHPPG